jgi:GT2 family glycosyltransferase
MAIVNWNTRELLLNCLEALKNEARGLALEVIVVDNASSDHSAEAVRRQYPDVQVQANPDNLGFARATNQALRQARGQFWGLINPDAEMKPGALGILIQELKARPDVMVVAPQLLNTDGSLQPSGRKFPTLFLTCLEGLLPGAWKKTKWWQALRFGRTDFSRACFVDEVSGACFIARREAFSLVGFLDEWYYIYFEEVDWFLRLAQQGGRVLYQPAARVVHHWGASLTQIPDQAFVIHLRSGLYYWRKHRGFAGEWCYHLITLLQVGVWLSGSLVFAFRPARRKKLAGYWRMFKRTLKVK